MTEMKINEQLIYTLPIPFRFVLSMIIYIYIHFDVSLLSKVVLFLSIVLIVCCIRIFYEYKNYGTYTLMYYSPHVFISY